MADPSDLALLDLVPRQRAAGTCNLVPRQRAAGTCNLVPRQDLVLSNNHTPKCNLGRTRLRMGANLGEFDSASHRECRTAIYVCQWKTGHVKF